MIIAIILLLALTLLLAPLYAAQPDGPRVEALASFEWASFLCAGIFLAVLLAVPAARRGGPFAARLSAAEKAFLVLLGLAFLSVPTRLALQHGTGYFGVMLRGWSVLAADFALFALARRVAGNKILLYSLVLAAAAGSAMVADLGVQEYLTHLRAGDPQWRIFASSSPDFLAGYFVLLLPVTLSLFLEVPSLRGLTPLLRGMASLVLGVVLLLQIAAFLTTQSRFGLVSLGVSLIVFAVGFIATILRGLVLPKATRGLLGVFGVGLVLGGAVLARPVLLRLQNLHDNSAAFRVWTWRGSLHMALANPLLGTGIGTWTDLYPPYALTGFTRLAHNSYLQLADECGLPALLALLAALALLGGAVTRGLRRPPEAGHSIDSHSSGFLPQDSRVLLCGLAGSLAGGAVQNLSDSDWYVFFLGALFWAFAGLAAGLAEAQGTEQPPAKLNLIAAGSAAAALLLLTGTQGIGAGYGVTAAAQMGSDPGGAAESDTSARAWDPVSSVYPGNLGYQIDYSRSGDLANAEAALGNAIALEPNSVNYRRLGTVLQAAGRTAEAVAAYRNGLQAEPNSVELLLRLARLAPPAQSLQYYRRLSDLELTPVGTARALGESVEPDFAYADAALGDAPGQAPAAAAVYYARAATLLETYIGQGGSTNIQREVIFGGRPDPQTDAAFSTLYTRVMTRWAALAPPEQQAGLKARQAKFQEKFAAVLEEASKDALKPGML